MISLILPALEKAINFYLHLDPDIQTQLALLDNKIIQVSVTDWHLIFYIYPEGTGFRLRDTADTTPDTIMTGTFWRLFKTGLAKGSSAALFENRIEISGDIKTGETMRHILTHINIDWEEYLSKYVGDIAAHQIMVGAKQSITVGKNILRTLKENMTEFLQSESRTVPAASEVEQFVEDVTTLQYAVDRIAARFERLKSQKGLR